jgi:nucleoside-diphosphate-sugar epimerase
VSRVLVTGGTGFIGRHATAALVAAGHEVHVTTASGRPAPDGAEAHRVDLLDASATTALVESLRPEELLHLAWDVTPGVYLRSPANIRWTTASTHLLREFVRDGRRAVLAGSVFEYDPFHAGGLLVEDGPLRPATLYATCKDALRSVAEALGRESGVEIAWGRAFFMYGPGEYPTRLVASVARAVLSGEEAPVSHGRQVRDYMHVADMGEAFAALLLAGATGAVNLGTGEGTALADLVGAVSRAAGRPELIRLGARESDPGEAPLIVADTTRLREEVGWVPTRTLADGVAETVDWWRAELQAERAASRSDAIM